VSEEADARGVDTRSFRHWGGFIFSGGLAFLIDAGITAALHYGAGADPFSSRLVGIVVAMVAAWLLHRRITFDVAAAASLGEFTRFVGVAGSANALNYAIYALILLWRPAVWPLAALVCSTAVATVFSYLGFRLGVFRTPPPAV
jgi:putative flippase GtrA